MQCPQLIVLDLDGTLIDSAPDLAYAIREMLDHLGRKQVSEQQVRNWIGNGVSMLVKRALNGEMQAEDEPLEFNRAFEVFSNIYVENVSVRSTLYPGVIQGLQQLSSSGFNLACITNKHSRFTRPLMERTGLGHYFDYVGCGDDFEHLKPHPLPLVKTAERFDANPAQSVMVGDSLNDIQAARAAGFRVCCVSYGYLNGLRVEDLNADLVIDSLTDLPKVFNGQPDRQNSHPCTSH